MLDQVWLGYVEASLRGIGPEDRMI